MHIYPHLGLRQTQICVILLHPKLRCHCGTWETRERGGKKSILHTHYACHGRNAGGALQEDGAMTR